MRGPRLDVLLLALIVFAAGCVSRTYLPVSPNVLRDGSGTAQLKELLPDQHVADMRIFYITDRAGQLKGNRMVYGHARAGDIAYGEATVSLGKGVTWDKVVAYSSKGKMTEYVMRVSDVQELGRFVTMAARMKAENGRIVMTDAQGKAREEAQAQTILSDELAKTPHKDVYLFVHGFNNSFEDAVLRMAGLWHYLGRRGVPVAYTWPAGYGGLFGYFYDRESGEFTIYHLKRALKVIAGCKDVERIHIIAHSRGTDVVTTALRELNIEYTARGEDPQKQLKLDTLVLAAPDLDRDVFRQRFTTENLIGVSRQTVLYTSPEDKAIGLAAWLFGSTARIGQGQTASLSPTDRAALKQLPQVQVVVADVSGFSTTHDYVFYNPAALSDLVLVLRDHRFAGAANGRPLEYDDGVWLLTNRYYKRK